MSASINPWIIVGGAAAIYLLTKPKTTTNPATGVTTTSPGGLTSIIPPGITSLLPGGTTSNVPTYGVNSGIKGGNGSFYTCANYQALLAAYPNLANPNYQMTAAENAQYLNNYQDLKTGLPAWIGVKGNWGTTPQNLAQAAQAHWTTYGCAEQRIYLPLQPPSTAAFIPPPVNPNATASGGGSSWVGTAISTVGSVALALLGNQIAEVPVLNDAEANVLITGAAIAKKILPFYLQVAPDLVHSVENNIDAALSQYQD